MVCFLETQGCFIAFITNHTDKTLKVTIEKIIDEGSIIFTDAGENVKLGIAGSRLQAFKRKSQI